MNRCSFPAANKPDELVGRPRKALRGRLADESPEKRSLRLFHDQNSLILLEEFELDRGGDAIPLPQCFGNGQLAALCNLDETVLSG